MTPTPMPKPPEVPGVAWRPARMSDAPGLANLAGAVDGAEGLEFVGGPEFWTWWLDQHDLAHDTTIAVHETGAVVAAAGSWGQDTETGARSVLWLDAHPDHLALDTFLLGWAEERARRQLAASSHSDRVIRLNAEEHRRRRRAVIEEAGFRAARTFVEMSRSLTDPIPHPAPADGPTIVTLRPELDESARIASNAAFADHWGSLPMSKSTWASMVLDEDVTRRDLSFLAVVGGNVVGMCLASVDLEDDPGCLWIERVAVVPSRRRRGLASILLLRSLRAGAAAGLRTAHLSVDEESGWDAHEMYRRLGFSIRRRSVTYIKELK